MFSNHYKAGSHQSPAEILANAQEDRPIIQDYCPLAESLEWELGQRYLHERGSLAFISDAIPVPFAINNNGNMSLRAAHVFLASLIEAEKSTALDADIFVLELGVGLGLFARYFLDAFRELCEQNGRDFYERLTYVAADRSEQMLLDVCRRGVLADHPGRYLLRIVDAQSPDKYLSTDISLPRRPGRVFHAVFLNYLLDCLPAAVLDVNSGVVRQLCIRASLARGVQLKDFTDLTVDDLARRAGSSNARDKHDLLHVFGLLTSEYDFQPVDPSTLPYGEFAVQFARSHGGGVLHNYGALQCIERLLPLLCEDGFILVNDYGSSQNTNSTQFEHQRYTGSTFVGINFALLKTFLRESCRCEWTEPLPDNDQIYSRLLTHKSPPTVIAAFQRHFNKDAFEWTEAPARLARQCAKEGRHEIAATNYRQALERQPTNWMLLREVADFLTFTLGNPRASLELATLAISLNPACSPELWNSLGDSLFALRRVDEAREAFQRALHLSPSDVQARYNLAWVFGHEGDYSAALSTIAEGLGLDKFGHYRERLLKKQAEILAHSQHRSRQEFQALVNRVTRYTPVTDSGDSNPIKPTKDVKQASES